MKLELVDYTGSNWSRDIEERKSTSSYIFNLGTRAFLWSLKKQQVVALSITEAEFIAAADCATQVIWFHRMLNELQYIQDYPTTIYCNNKSTIALTKNLVFHGCIKHIDIKDH